MFTTEQGVLIGEASDVIGDVRKRTKSSMVWTPVQKSDSIHADDLIHTGSESEVSIAFEDGHRLKIHPYSRIQFQSFSNDTEVRASQGGVELLEEGKNSQKKLKLTTGPGGKAMYLDKKSIGKVMTRSGVSKAESFQKMHESQQQKKASGSPSQNQRPQDTGKSLANANGKQVAKKLKGKEIPIKEKDDRKLRMRRTLILGYFGAFVIIGIVAFLINFVLPRFIKERQ